MKKSLCFSDVVEGYLLYAHARHLSPNMIRDYSNTFQRFFDFLAEDVPF